MVAPISDRPPCHVSPVAETSPPQSHVSPVPETSPPQSHVSPVLETSPPQSHVSQVPETSPPHVSPISETSPPHASRSGRAVADLPAAPAPSASRPAVLTIRQHIVMLSPCERPENMAGSVGSSLAPSPRLSPSASRRCRRLLWYLPAAAGTDVTLRGQSAEHSGQSRANQSGGDGMRKEQGTQA